jgi:hypothetical protein
MMLKSTQPLTEMSARNLLGGKGLTTLPQSLSRLSRTRGSLSVTGIVLPFGFNRLNSLLSTDCNIQISFLPSTGTLKCITLSYTALMNGKCKGGYQIPFVN